MSVLAGHEFVWLIGTQEVKFLSYCLPGHFLKILLLERVLGAQSSSKVSGNLSFLSLPFLHVALGLDVWEGRAEWASMWGHSGSWIITRAGNHWVHQTHLLVHDSHPDYKVMTKILTCSACTMEEKKTVPKPWLGRGRSFQRWMPQLPADTAVCCWNPFWMHVCVHGGLISVWIIPFTWKFSQSLRKLEALSVLTWSVGDTCRYGCHSYCEEHWGLV